MSNRDKFRFFYVLSLAFQLGFLIVVPLLLILLGGIFLDKKFNASPLFTIICIAFSLLFIIFEIYNFFLPIIRKENKE